MQDEAISISRSFTVDLFCDDQHRQPTIDSIRLYRHCCRELFAAYLVGQVAGAKLVENKNGGVSLKPNNDACKVALAVAIGGATIKKHESGKKFTVTTTNKGITDSIQPWLKEELCPTFMSFMRYDIARTVETVWRSGDPEFPTAKRGFLALQGARDIARFSNRGMGFKPDVNPKLNGHTLTLKWDEVIGPVTFRIGKLDHGRYYLWKCLRDGVEGWKLGTIYLKEQNGKIAATITYTRTLSVSVPDMARTCKVRFSADKPVITLSGPDNIESHDTIELVEAIAWLRQMKKRREYLEERRNACGSSRRSRWGFKNGLKVAQEVLSRATTKRELGQKDRNHAWTRKIIEAAERWRCGIIEVGEFPDGLAGEPWAWSSFLEKLKYKAQEKGMAVVAPVSAIDKKKAQMVVSVAKLGETCSS